MSKKNKNLIFIPNLRSYEVKNPPSLVPVDWVEKYGEDRVRFELEPKYDENGNYLGTKKNVYVTMFKVIGWKIIKRKNVEEEIDIKHNLESKKLFETYSDIEEKEKSLSPVLR